MSELVYGDRVGKDGRLRPGASAIIYGETKDYVLLTRRTDNGRWCLPGGGMDPGESAAEACAREVVEETGLIVRVGKLVGVYTTPNMVIVYADGNRIQPVAFSFEAEEIGGELGLSDETTEYGYYTLDDMKDMDMMEHHLERIIDAQAGQDATFIK